MEQINRTPVDESSETQVLKEKDEMVDSLIKSALELPIERSFQVIGHTDKGVVMGKDGVEYKVEVRDDFATNEGPSAGSFVITEYTRDDKACYIVANRSGSKSALRVVSGGFVSEIGTSDLRGEITPNEVKIEGGHKPFDEVSRVLEAWQ